MHKFADSFARLFALLGGIVLVLLILLTCFSVVGLSLNSMLHSDFLQSVFPSIANTLLATGVGPINGDFELVEAGVAFAIFAFLPLCQLNGSHASVDIFTSFLSPKINQVIRVITEVVFAAVIVLITWRLFLGTMNKMNSGETTFLLQFPVWWAYALSFIAAVAAALTALYVALMRFTELVTGKQILPDELEAEH